MAEVPGSESNGAVIHVQHCVGSVGMKGGLRIRGSVRQHAVRGKTPADFALITHHSFAMLAAVTSKGKTQTANGREKDSEALDPYLLN